MTQHTQSDSIPRLTTLYLYISGSCNLSCKHCWVSPNKSGETQDGNYLGLELVDKLLDESIPLGLHTVKITGGEPFLHPKLRDILSLFHNAGIHINCETNGTLITKNLASFLKNRSSINFISVSIDGYYSDTHDNFRQSKGSFELTIKGIRSLIEEGFKPQLIYTIHKNNYSEISQFLDMATKLGCGSVKFNHIHPMGRGIQLSDDFSLVEIIELYKDIEANHAHNVPFSIYFDIPVAFRSINNLVHQNYSYCSVLNMLGIVSNGDISLCGIGETVHDLVFGNLHHDSIHNIWTNHPTLINLRKCIPWKLKGVCSKCIFLHICRGHCLALNYLSSGRIDSGHPFCEDALSQNVFPLTRLKHNIETEVPNESEK